MPASELPQQCREYKSRGTNFFCHNLQYFGKEPRLGLHHFFEIPARNKAHLRACKCKGTQAVKFVCSDRRQAENGTRADRKVRYFFAVVGLDQK
jgi:hypothetical protein